MAIYKQFGLNLSQLKWNSDDSCGTNFTRILRWISKIQPQFRPLCLVCLLKIIL